jgi:4-carboxymuconolactone decarboxylase
MATDASPGQAIADTAPKLAELTDNLIFGDIWERPGLSKRDRSLITVAALVALDRKQIAGHMRRALENGVTKDELVETITHLSIYAGFPAAVSAILVLQDLNL